MLRFTLVLAFATVVLAEGLHETVIFLKKQTNFGENVFIRGGVGGATDCTNSANPMEDPCAIEIEHIDLDMETPTPLRDALAEKDLYLSWADKENGQDIRAQGTPAQWTTNENGTDYYNSLNLYGSDYWMVQVYMNCSQLPENELFEFKGFMNGYEGDISSSVCLGDGAVSNGTLPFTSKNHVGRCGYINVFEWESANCTITSFP